MRSNRAALICLAAFALTLAPAHAARGRMLIEGGKWVTVNGQTFYENPPQKSDTCTNVAPDNRYTCEQQKNFGACDQEFMKQGNYCLYTCGRCPSGGGSPPPSSPSGGGGKKSSSPAPPSSSGGGGSNGGFAPPGKPDVCDDIAPNGQYTCAQQRDFGKCREWYITDNHFCAKTCGLPPCPPVANLPVRNGTSTSIGRRQAPRGNRTAVTAPTTTTAVPEAGPTPIVTAVPIIATSPTVENATAGAANVTEATVTNATQPITTPVVGGVENTTAGVANTTEGAANATQAAATNATGEALNATAANTTAPAETVPPTAAQPGTTAPVAVVPAAITPTTTTTAPAPPASPATPAPPASPATPAPPAEGAAPAAPAVVASPAVNLTEPTAPVIPAAEAPAAEPGLAGGLPGASNATTP